MVLQGPGRLFLYCRSVDLIINTNEMKVFFLFYTEVPKFFFVLLLSPSYREIQVWNNIFYFEDMSATQV